MPRQCGRCSVTAAMTNRKSPDILRTYSELITFPTFKERFDYLKLDGTVGADTFGFDRYMNQQFYRSYEWKKVRDQVIVRDNGCDLGVSGYFIRGQVYIHHLNPISPQDLYSRSQILLDPEYLVCVSHATHNAIHYGDASQLQRDPVVRRPNDTCPWKE